MNVNVLHIHKLSIAVDKPSHVFCKCKCYMQIPLSRYPVCAIHISYLFHLHRFFFQWSDKIEPHISILIWLVRSIVVTYWHDKSLQFIIIYAVWITQLCFCTRTLKIIEFREWITNYTHERLLSIITHPDPNFNGDSNQTSFRFGYGLLIIIYLNKYMQTPIDWTMKYYKSISCQLLNPKCPLHVNLIFKKPVRSSLIISITNENGFLNLHKDKIR